jgi:hypothetical protein
MAGLRDVSGSNFGEHRPHAARSMLRLSRQIIQPLPFLGNMCLDRRYRHLGPSAGDQGGEDDPERFSLTGKGHAGEHESEGAAGALRSCGDAGIGRFEAEAVPSFDGADLLGEAAGQREEVLRTNIGGDVTSKASQSLRGQRRRYEQPLRLEVEGWIHGPGDRPEALRTGLDYKGGKHG